MSKILQKANHLKSIVSKYKHQDLSSYPTRVRIVEVGPRDGLQNESRPLSTDFKINFINQLSQTGLTYIESTAFVSPKWIPQMAGNFEVLTGIQREKGITYSALVPNMKGMESAKLAGVQEIAVFTAASEGFTKKNINCSIQESLRKFGPVIEDALANGIKIRGYVSCVMGCPYEGPVDPRKVDEVTNQLLGMGCYEVSLGDTIGVGTPELTRELMETLSADRDRLAAHFHDTGDKAIENILVALSYGVSVLDSSVAGLGGCPYSKSPTGNVCSENVIWVLKELGIDTGVDLAKLHQVGLMVSKELDRESLSAGLL